MFITLFSPLPVECEELKRKIGTGLSLTEAQSYSWMDSKGGKKNFVWSHNAFFITLLCHQRFLPRNRLLLVTKNLDKEINKNNFHGKCTIAFLDGCSFQRNQWIKMNHVTVRGGQKVETSLISCCSNVSRSRTMHLLSATIVEWLAGTRE